MLLVTRIQRALAAVLVSLAVMIAVGSCGTSPLSDPPPTTRVGRYAAEIAELSADSAVQWVPPGAEVDEVRVRDDCIDGFDPVVPQYVRSYVFSEPRDVEAIAAGFRSAFADAGWDIVVDAPSTENTGGPNGVGLSFTKSFGDWSALAEVSVADPGDKSGRGLSTYVVASIDPIPCEQ